MKRIVIACGILAMLVGMLSAVPLTSTTAEEKKASSTKKSTTKKSTSKKSTKKDSDEKVADDAAPKFKGRLPAYYASVVDEKQRAQIYKLQEEYHNKLGELKKQHAKEVKELEAEEDEAIEDVLTEEQKETVAELKAKRRSNSKTASKKPSTKKE